MQRAGNGKMLIGTLFLLFFVGKNMRKIKDYVFLIPVLSTTVCQYYEFVLANFKLDLQFN